MLCVGLANPEPAPPSIPHLQDGPLVHRRRPQLWSNLLREKVLEVDQGVGGGGTRRRRLAAHLTGGGGEAGGWGFRNRGNRVGSVGILPKLYCPFQGMYCTVLHAPPVQ